MTVPEVLEVLEQLPVAIRALVRVREREGAHATLVDWPCGLVLRVTEKEARVYAPGAPREVGDALHRAQVNFAVASPP